MVWCGEYHIFVVEFKNEGSLVRTQFAFKQNFLLKQYDSVPSCVYSFVYTSATLMRCVVCMRRVSGARLINFPRTRGEQRTPGAWKGHAAHPVLFVFAQKTNKFWFAANGMRTIRRWHSTGSLSHPHIRVFGLRTVCEQFVNHSARSYIWGLTMSQQLANFRKADATTNICCRTNKRMVRTPKKTRKKHDGA